MFGQTWYFDTIRKYVILVGTLFNDIRITKKDKNGNTVSLVRVPITYGPKDKMLARVFQDPNIDRPTATFPLPMISFEMGKIQYDGARKLHTTGRIAVKNDAASNDANKFKYQYNPVPYNINFKVFIYTKNVEDGTKVLEQILPFFTPDWTTRVNLIPEMEVIMDIPVILNNIDYADSYEGDLKDVRKIIWTLDLTVKGYFYGPIKKTGIIKFVNVDFFIPNVPDGSLPDAVGNTEMATKLTVQPGVDANTGQPINYYGGPNTNINTLPYQEIEANSDFGYITQIYDLVTREGEYVQQTPNSQIIYVTVDSDTIIVDTSLLNVDVTIINANNNYP